jgi:hypothetical protein
MPSMVLIVSQNQLLGLWVYPTLTDSNVVLALVVEPHLQQGTEPVREMTP